MPCGSVIGSNMPDFADLGRLYDEHAQALFAFLLNFTRNEADTRDLLQELFVKVARQPGILSGVREERSFLIRLAHNLAIDLMRRRGTRQRNYEQLAGESSGLFTPAGNPDEQEFRRALTAALAELPPEQREVFVAHELDGRSFKEQAARTGVSVNTLLSRKRYAVQHLRRRLQRIHDELTRV